MKKPLFIVAILMFSALALQAQESATTMAREGSTLPLSFNLSPGVFVPLGETSTYFILGASSIFGVSYRLPLRLVALVAEVGYGWDPMREATQSLSLGSIAAGAGLRFDLGPRFLLKLQGQGGYYQGILHSTGDFISDGGAYLSVGAGATFFVTPVLGLGLGARYVNYIPVSQGLIGALELTWDRAGAADRAKAIRVRAPARRPELLRGEVIKGEGEGLKLNEIHWENIFPVLYKYYDAHRIGYAVLKNNEEEPVTDVKLTLMIKGYMDSPMSCPTPPELKGGGQITVDLPALFNKSVLEITETEGTKVAVDLSLQYKYRGEWIQETQNQQLRILNRNNMVWDDDRKVAAFVTSTDPAVQLFSKNVLNITKGRGSRAVNENLMSAMALHEALYLYGVNYVIDPRSSYAELSQTKDEVDYLQFPRQTLEVQGGDCDDLSILYCALLESVNIPAAFITVPGHIFIAVSLNMSSNEAMETFSKVDDLIFLGDAVWLPIEVTERQGGFVKAWQEGARQWREFAARRQSNLYPFAEAAQLYESATYIDTASRVSKSIVLPAEDKVVRAYLEELIRFIDGEIYPRVVKLQGEIKSSRENPQAVNKLGVLYAKYGLYDRAQREFERILTKAPTFFPALVNIGNIFYLQGKMEDALSYYEQAYRLVPENPTVLLAMAQASHKLENYGFVAKVYGKLKQLEPDLASQFAYLDLRGEEAARSADVTKTKGVVRWSDEN